MAEGSRWDLAGDKCLAHKRTCVQLISLKSTSCITWYAVQTTPLPCVQHKHAYVRGNGPGTFWVSWRLLEQPELHGLMVPKPHAHSCLLLSTLHNVRSLPTCPYVCAVLKAKAPAVYGGGAEPLGEEAAVAEERRPCELVGIVNLHWA
jgi:hypothetical protein